MTPRTFWTIFIKILGIWIILSSMITVPEFLTAIAYFGKVGGAEGVIIWILLLILVIALFAAILKLFVFKTDWVIDKLKLDKDFTEEKIDLNIHRSTILNIAIIVIGGLMFIDGLPLLIKDLFQYYQEKDAFSRFTQNPKTGWIIYYIIKVVIGYLLMIYSKVVVNLIERQRKPN
jgi:hypothetical protein